MAQNHYIRTPALTESHLASVNPNHYSNAFLHRGIHHLPENCKIIMIEQLQAEIKALGTKRKFAVIWY